MEKKKNKWTLERKLSMLFMLCICAAIPSIGHAIEVMFPELNKWDQWVLLVLVLAILSTYFGRYFYSMGKVAAERRAKEQALGEAKKKEKSKSSARALRLPLILICCMIIGVPGLKHALAAAFPGSEWNPWIVMAFIVMLIAIYFGFSPRLAPNDEGETEEAKKEE